MSDKKYIDIKVIDGGWQIDAGQQPTQCSDLYSIAQDIKHSIMESGLARELIAERSPVLRSDVLIQIEQLAEQDIRIIPGTATATEAEDISLTADTYEYGTDMSITVGEVEIKTIILDVEKEEPTIPAFTGVEVGEAIILDGNVYTDQFDNPTYDLLPVGSSFDDSKYPELAALYPSLTLPIIPNAIGSTIPYQIVADYKGRKL